MLVAPCTRLCPQPYQKSNTESVVALRAGREGGREEGTAGEWQGGRWGQKGSAVHVCDWQQ
jgi:hypothetical protein